MSCARTWVAYVYLLGGILFGALLMLGVAVRRRVRQHAKRAAAQQQAANGISVYLNVFLTNKDEVVHKTVLKKVHGTFVQKLASKVATKLVSNESVALKVGNRLAEAVPRKLETKKLKADAACVFVQGGLAVVKINVTGIDLLGLIARQMPDKRMHQVRSAYRCWNRCGTGGEDEIAFHILKQRAEIAFRAEVWAQIESQCLSSLGSQIEAKLWNDAGVEAIVVPKSSGTQAQFFYDILETMNVPHRRRKNTDYAAGTYRRRLTPGMTSALPLLMRERGPRIASDMLDPDQLFVAASNFLSRTKNAEMIYRRLRYREREGEIESAVQICKLFAALHERATSHASGGGSGGGGFNDGDGENTSSAVRHALKLSVPEAKKQYVVMLGDLMPKWKKELASLDPKNAGSQRQNELLELSKHVEKKKSTDKQLREVTAAHSNASAADGKTQQRQQQRQQQQQQQQQLPTKLSRPSPLSIFLQPLLFPEIQPLPVGRLHCRVVAAHGLRKTPRGLLSNAIDPCIALSVGIPPEPFLPPQLLQGLALHCGPMAAGAKHILTRQWKKQQEQTTEAATLGSRLSLRLLRSGPSDLKKLAHHNNIPINMDHPADKMEYHYEVARGITRTRHGMLNPVWNDVDSTFVLPVQSTSRLSCLRIAVLDGNHDAQGGGEILCEAAVDLFDLFQNPHDMSHVWCDMYVDLVAPNHAVAAVQPRDHRGGGSDKGKVSDNGVVHGKHHGKQERRRLKSLMRRVGSVFSSTSSASSSLSPSSSTPFPLNATNNAKDGPRSGQTSGNTMEPNAGTIHLRLKFETLASNLSKVLANQAVLTLQQQQRETLQKTQSLKQAAKETEAAEMERVQVIQEERARLNKKRASLSNVLGSAVKVVASAEQAAEKYVLGGASLNNTTSTPSTAKEAMQKVLKTIENKLERFAREWGHELDAKTGNLCGPKNATDDILLFTIYLATSHASFVASQKSDLLRRFSSLQFQYEWWQTWVVLADLLEPLLRMGSYCFSPSVVFRACLVLLYWMLVHPYMWASTLLEQSGLNAGIAASLLKRFRSLAGEAFVQRASAAVTVLSERADKYTILSAGAWIVVLRVLCLRLCLRQRPKMEQSHLLHETGKTKESSSSDFLSWGLLAQQGLARSRQDLKDFLDSVLLRENAFVIANLADADTREQAGDVLLSEHMCRANLALETFRTRGLLSLVRRVGKSVLVLPRLLGKSWSGDATAASKLLLCVWMALTISIYCGARSLKSLVVVVVAYCLVRKTATARAVEDVVWFSLQLAQCT